MRTRRICSHRSRDEFARSRFSGVANARNIDARGWSPNRLRCSRSTGHFVDRVVRMQGQPASKCSLCARAERIRFIGETPADYANSRLHSATNALLLFRESRRQTRREPTRRLFPRAGILRKYEERGKERERERVTLSIQVRSSEARWKNRSFNKRASQETRRCLISSR